MNDAVIGHQAIGGASSRGKPDPNVKIPPAVKAAAERAEALSKQAREAAVAAAVTGGDQPINATQQPPAQRTPQGVVTANFDPRNPNPPTDVPGNPDVKPRFTSSQPQPDIKPQFTPPPAPQPVQPQQAQPQTQQPQTQQSQTQEDWEHQFRSLKGRYDQEAANNRRLAQQVNDMQRLMATINSPPAPQFQEGSGVRFNSSVAGGANAPQFQRRITPKDVAEFGEETIDVMGRRAQEVVEPMLAQVVAEINNVKRQLGGVANTVVFDARTKMYDDLAKEVPNWDTVNNSPEFAHWLDQVDPISRQTRRTFLNAAHNANITGQVVDIFRGFLANQAAFGPSGSAQQPGNGAGGYTGYSPSNSGNPAASTPQAVLAQFAAPGRAKSGQTEVPPEKPVFTRADITQFYRDKTAGRYAGREAEANQIERALFEAGNEGRIR